MRRLCLALIASGICVQPAVAALCSSVDYGHDKACSLTGVNGNCTIIVDRMNAATPSTIYLRRKSIVTLKVVNRSSLEKLELDETSINTQSPIDPVQALAPLLTQLGQFALPIPAPIGAALVAQTALGPASNPPAGSKSFKYIQDEQIHLLNAIRGDTALDPATLTRLAGALAVLRTLLVPALDGCNKDSDWNVAMAKLPDAKSQLTTVQNAIERLAGKPGSGAGGAGDRMADDTTALANIQADIDQFASGMAAEQKKSEEEISALKASNFTLQKKIDEEQMKRRPDRESIRKWKDTLRAQEQDMQTKKADAQKAADGWQVQLDQLKAGQTGLTDVLTKAQSVVKTVYFPAQNKLQALVDAINNKPVSPDSFPIKDLLDNDKNDQQEVFTLNAVNYLTDPVKIFIASTAMEPYSQVLADSIVVSPPVKAAVMRATVMYVTQPEVEVTAGVLVPFWPYKSYTAAPQSAGSATLVAQETHTFVVVPTVDLNFRLGNEKFAGRKRYGWFGTVAVGYNPATTMVEFGVGPTVALKSMVFSFLADIGRDTELASGFTKNQPLPGAATATATNGVWSVKPSIGFSIRLPFNSGSGH